MKICENIYYPELTPENHFIHLRDLIRLLEGINLLVGDLWFTNLK
jgi:hypothetical protein